MRFHVLGLPHTVSSKEYIACAYTQKVVKFAKMMTARGHTVIHYGHEESKLDCTEHVTVLTTSDWKKSYGDHDWRKHFFKFNTQDHAYQTFYKNAIIEVGKRKQKGDFILPFWGNGVRPICDAHPDIITVEPGIGYAGGHWAKFKIFESYAILHAYYGLSAVGECKQSWYDVVIPNYFDPDDFIYNDKKDDYFLFLGRVYSGKGVHIAIQAIEKTGEKLIIAGQNAEQGIKSFGYDKVPKCVEIFGFADLEARKKLMANAKGAFVASMYVEPFGGVQVECLLSGTPTITTDWGSFTENNIHGVTGYRCRTFEHFTWAVKNISNIKPENCRKFGENFTFDKVAPMYEEYFQNVANIYNGTNGWYAPNPNRKNLDYLRKICPQTNDDIVKLDEKNAEKNKLQTVIIKKNINTNDVKYFIRMASTGYGTGDAVCLFSACQTFIKRTGSIVYVNSHPDVVAAYKNDRFRFGNQGGDFILTPGFAQRSKCTDVQSSIYFNYLGTILSSMGLLETEPPSLELPIFEISPNEEHRALIQPFSRFAKNPPIEYIQEIVNTFQEITGKKLYVIGGTNTPRNLQNVDYSLVKDGVADIMKLVQNASVVLTPRSLSANLAAGYKIPAFVWVPNDGESWHLNYPMWDYKKCEFEVGIDLMKAELCKFLNKKCS